MEVLDARQRSQPLIYGRDAMERGGGGGGGWGGWGVTAGATPIFSLWTRANIFNSRSLIQLSGLRLSFHLHLINWLYAPVGVAGCQSEFPAAAGLFSHQDGFQVDCWGLLLSINWSAG